LTTQNLDRGSGQLLFERYQTGSLSNWCWQGIPNTGGLWEETVFVTKENPTYYDVQDHQQLN
jgi:hypothetical protein